MCVIVCKWTVKCHIVFAIWVGKMFEDFAIDNETYRFHNEKKTCVLLPLK